MGQSLPGARPQIIRVLAQREGVDPAPTGARGCSRPWSALWCSWPTGTGRRAESQRGRDVRGLRRLRRRGHPRPHRALGRPV